MDVRGKLEVEGRERPDRGLVLPSSHKLHYVIYVTHSAHSGRHFGIPATGQWRLYKGIVDDDCYMACHEYQHNTR